MNFTMRNPVIQEVLNNKYCEGCSILRRADCKERIGVRDRALELNSQHVPEVVSILFVAESPPKAFMWKRSAYFYASGPERPRSLAYYINQVLFKGRIGKDEFFRKFKELGFYLVDVVKCPIGGLSSQEVSRAIECCVKYLNEELEVLRPVKVVFIGRTMFKKARRFLNLGSRTYYVLPLPFRSVENVRKFKRELAKVLEQELK